MQGGDHTHAQCGADRVSHRPVLARPVRLALLQKRDHLGIAQAVTRPPPSATAATAHRICSPPRHAPPPGHASHATVRGFPLAALVVQLHSTRTQLVPDLVGGRPIACLPSHLAVLDQPHDRGVGHVRLAARQRHQPDLAPRVLAASARQTTDTDTHPSISRAHSQSGNVRVAILSR
jgi:hypothetical protein